MFVSRVMAQLFFVRGANTHNLYKFQNKAVKKKDKKKLKCSQYKHSQEHSIPIHVRENKWVLPFQAIKRKCRWIANNQKNKRPADDVFFKNFFFRLWLSILPPPYPSQAVLIKTNTPESQYPFLENPTHAPFTFYLCAFSFLH